MKTLLVVVALVGAAFGQDCGESFVTPNPEGRIVNGVEATPNSWPWQVAMCRSGSLRCSLMCGSTVIKADVILTAAHCVVGQSARRVGWKYAAHSLSSTEQDGQGIRRSSGFGVHPGYDSQTIVNDIAIVRLTQPIEFNNKVQPICLANTDDHLEGGTLVTSIGWGRIRGQFSPISDLLLQANLVHHDRATCNEIFDGFNLEFDDTWICAGGTEDGKSVCFGDSGGPYFKQDSQNSRYYQYGINSFVTSRACAQEGRPNGFARVSALCGFLEEAVGEPVCSTPPEAEGARFHIVGESAPVGRFHPVGAAPPAGDFLPVGGAADFHPIGGEPLELHFA